MSARKQPPAEAAPAPEPSMGDGPEEAPIAYVAMVRDPVAFPEGPHTATVHPDEVENFALGGWTVA